LEEEPPLEAEPPLEEEPALEEEPPLEAEPPLEEEPPLELDPPLLEPPELFELLLSELPPDELEPPPPALAQPKGDKRSPIARGKSRELVERCMRVSPSRDRAKKERVLDAMRGRIGINKEASQLSQTPLRIHSVTNGLQGVKGKGEGWNSRVK
jgi:hypothetical protein